MTSGAIYQAGPIKRRRRTRAQVDELDEQILAVLRQDHPQSIRHCFYRMTDPRLPEPVEKTDNGYSQVQERITKLRRSGALPYGWISDATRRGHFVDTFDGAEDFLHRVAGPYRANLWATSPYYYEVWVVSRSLAGVVQADCAELAVSLYPCGGFASLTLAYQAAEYINARDDGKPVVIFYIGDFDPAGVLIDVALERELRGHLRSDISMSFERLGITPQQIIDYDLPTKPRKKTDQRSPHVDRTVEAEAMPATLMRLLLRNAVEALLPANAIETARAAEVSERGLIKGLSQMVRGGAALRPSNFDHAKVAPAVRRRRTVTGRWQPGQRHGDHPLFASAFGGIRSR